MIKVLFINAVDAASEVENRYRPLWPAYLAAYAEHKIGVGRFIFRFAATSVEEELESFDPHIVAISSVSQNYNYAIDYAKMAKQSGAVVIMGGFHISCIPDCLTEHMDVGCMGEGEETFSELLQCYLASGRLNHRDLGDVKGIVYREDNRLVATPTRSFAASLDQFPHPNRSVIGYQKHDYMFTSRGCPYRCTFCASSRFWDSVRYASPEHVIEEIRELVDHGVETISFYDDLFVAHKRRLKRIADLIVSNGFHRRVSFTCSCRANAVTQEVVDSLKAMNVVSVGMGLESGCDATLNYLKGNISVQQNAQAIGLLKKAGIQANASFIIGAPNETREEMLQTYRFIKDSRIDFFDIYTLTPLPGTPVWENAKKRGLVSDQMDWSRLNVNFEISADSAVIMSETMSRQELRTMYRKFRRLRLWRIAIALPTSPWLKDLPTMLIRLAREKISRFLKRLFKAG
jgi:anaerobic magnesium-protoporphyrin IX monomethyl ester cyclase